MGTIKPVGNISTGFIVSLPSLFSPPKRSRRDAPAAARFRQSRESKIQEERMSDAQRPLNRRWSRLPLTPNQRRARALWPLLIGALAIALVLTWRLGTPTFAQSDPDPEAGGGLRFVHATIDLGPVDVYIDGERVAQGLPFSEASPFQDVEPGDRVIQIVPTGLPPSSAVIDGTVTLEAGSDYQIVTLGRSADNSIGAQLVLVDRSALATGQTRVRLIHLAPEEEQVSLTIPDGETLFNRVAYQTATTYTTRAAGSLDLEIESAVPGAGPLATLADTSLLADTVYDLLFVGLAADDSLALVPIVTSLAPPIAGRPAAIFTGTCAELAADLPPLATPAFVLEDVIVAQGTPVGAGEATRVEASITTLDMALADLVTQDHAIDIRESDTATADSIACGEIGGIPLASGALAIGLRIDIDDEPGLTGVAYLGPGGQTTQVEVFLVQELDPPTPTPTVTATLSPTASASATTTPLPGEPTQPPIIPATEPPPPPTNTRVPPTRTPVPPPTSTPVPPPPPTDTPMPPPPTDTPAPPPPTDTPAPPPPPTETPTFTV